MILRPPRSPPFPYTTLFRSVPTNTPTNTPTSTPTPTQEITTVPGEETATPSVTPRVPDRTSTPPGPQRETATRSEEHTSELQSRQYLVCRLLLEKKKPTTAR